MRTLLILLAICSTALADPIRPNVVLIFIDDMGFGDVEFNGGTAARTPHLNTMAKEGRRFHDFYVGCAVCSGSRTSLMTGCHYQRLSMNAVLFPNSNHGLHPDEVTLADMLKEAGYQTACIGKWHLGHLPPCLPTYQGFDSYYGIPYSNDMWIDPANKLAKDLVVREGLTREEVEAGHRGKNQVPLMRGEEVIEYPVDQSTVTKRYTEEAIRFIEQHAQGSTTQNETSSPSPFFLYLPHTMVHLPLAVSEKFNDPNKKPIHNAIEEVDWSVGQILQTLKKTGIAEKTLVIFTSDNGAAVGTSLPLRAKKGSVYDGGIREPTLMWWPGTIPAGTMCTEVAATIDLMPTLAKLSGGELPGRKIDGKDIWPLMVGQEGAKSPHENYILMHGPGTVRSGRWKFYPWREGKGGRREAAKTDSQEPVQLYDTLADIGETKNLAAEFPDIVKGLQLAYDTHVAEIKANQRPTAAMKRPEGVKKSDRPGGPKKKSTEQFSTIFDGKTLKGWKATSNANWRVEGGAIMVDEGERGLLLHKDTYENYELTIEFKAAKGTNSGVFLNTLPKPASVTEDCYELNIAPPDNPFPTGSLVGRKKIEGAGESQEWRKFEIRVLKGHVTVKLDGRQVMNYQPEKPASGNRLGLQLNSGQVAFRNIRVKNLAE